MAAQEVDVAILHKNTVVLFEPVVFYISLSNCYVNCPIYYT
jgi:hypothetical protein